MAIHLAPETVDSKDRPVSGRSGIAAASRGVKRSLERLGQIQQALTRCPAEAEIGAR